jgi:hypothetical protein
MNNQQHLVAVLELVLSILTCTSLSFGILRKLITMLSTSDSTDFSAAKLSLSKSLQAALVTTAGLSANQFQKIWAEAFNELGN